MFRKSIPAALLLAIAVSVTIAEDWTRYGARMVLPSVSQQFLLNSMLTRI